MGIPSADPGSFDQLLRIGQFIAFLGGIGAVLWRLSRMATRFEMSDQYQSQRLEKLETSITKLSDIMVMQATQNTRLDNYGTMITRVMDDVSMLRRGEGFIRRNIDGEYPK